MNHSISLTPSWEFVFRIVFRDRGIIDDTAGVSNHTAFEVMKRNGDSIGEQSARTITQAKSLNRLFSEAAIEKIWMRCIQSFQLEIKRSVDDNIFGFRL